MDDHNLKDVASIGNESPTTPRPIEADVSISPVLQLHNDEELPDELIKILGADPQQQDGTDFHIHPALSSRWSHLMHNGLGKEEDEILTKYTLPSNCEALTPPEINPEIMTILPNPHLKRDKKLQEQQGQLSKGLVALARGIDLILTDRENIPKGLKQNLLECLSDSGRILTDLNYKLTIARRNLVTPCLSKAVKDTVEKTKPETFLFGTELGEKVKEAKTLERASKDLKGVHPSAYAPPGKPDFTLRNTNTRKRTGEGTSFMANMPLNRRRPARRQREAMRPTKGHFSNADRQDHQYRRKK